tara:strand:+ start:1087 stop:1434 length:348 start_codon:yes stop_codon:yes gene_type:complete
MAMISNLTIDQGASFKAEIDVKDSDGDALDLTGFTGAGQMRKTYSSSTKTDFDVEFKSPRTTGTVIITLTSTQTNALKAGRFVYDVEITSPGSSGSDVTRVVEGQIDVTPGVTRA